MIIRINFHLIDSGHIFNILIYNFNFSYSDKNIINDRSKRSAYYDCCDHNR